MKKIFYQSIIRVFTGLLFFCLITSCKKLIVIPDNPPGQIGTNAAFADSANVMSVVAGIYTNISATGQARFLSGAITLNTGLSGDELVPTSTSTTTLDVYNDAILPDNFTIRELWSDAYSQLYQVNIFLENMNASSNISPSLKQQLTGEIEVLRSLYYFNLVNLFGPVPLVTSTNYKTTGNLPRSSTDKVYAQIIADLTDARNKLNTNYPSVGHARPNKYTASAILAKVYLYQGQWQNAAEMASEVINSNQYNLESDLNAVFLGNSAEAVWQLPANGTRTQTSEASIFVPFVPFLLPGYYISQKLIGSFESADQRLQKWTRTNNVNGTNYTIPYKYKNINSTDPTTEDYMMMRLGELYLIRAEALAQQNKLTDAMQDVNIIRNRAGLSNSIASGQIDVLAAIMRERQIELFCEGGNRWYDLKRTNTVDVVLGANKPNWKQTAALYPVPLSEMRLNPFLTQNPGY